MPVINSLLVKREGGGDSGSLLPIPPDVQSAPYCWDIINKSDVSTRVYCLTVSRTPQPDDLVYFVYNPDQPDHEFKPLPGLTVQVWEDGPVVPFIGWIKVSRYDSEEDRLYFKVDNLGEIPYLFGVEV